MQKEKAELDEKAGTFFYAKIVNTILMCEQKDEKMQCNQF